MPRTQFVSPGLAVAALAAALLLLDCHSSSERDPLLTSRVVAARKAADAALEGLDPRIRAVWSRHDNTLEKAVTSEIRSPDFEETHEFFDHLVPISLRLDFQYVGAVTTPATKEALIEIREWLAANADRLYWDEATATVRVRPAPG